MFKTKTLKYIALLSGLPSLYALDRLNEKVASRNLKTLYTGLVITIDYKLNFNADNAEGIDALHERVATRILNLCKDNGGLYIKIGQQIASINHVLPPKWNQIFRVLYDDAPVVPLSAYLPMFLKEFGKAPEEMFKSFDTVPVASASIAQVHRATLFSGEQVAVKIQKPYIEKQMKWDLACYRLVSYLFEKAFDLPIYWSVDHIESHLRTEVNFLNEAENAEKANEYIQQTDFKDSVYIPKVYWSHSSKRVMTCEWIDGVKFTDRDTLVSQGFNISTLMTTMVNVFADQIFRVGFIHCDPHPGNLILRHFKGRQQIVLLDHGLYTRSRPEFTRQYAAFWKALFTLDVKQLNTIAESWGIMDTESFVSATLQRPWTLSSKPLYVETSSYSMKDIYALQVNAKDKVKQFLKNTDTLPKELIFIGRNLNLIRSNNKALGSPVNRVNLMAHYAAKSVMWRDTSKMRFLEKVKCIVGDVYGYSVFQSTLFVSTLSFYGNRFIQTVYEYFTGKRGLGHEDVLDHMAMMSMRKFGLQVDESSFNA